MANGNGLNATGAISVAAGTAPGVYAVNTSYVMKLTKNHNATVTSHIHNP
jgi:hypothetical protein